MKTSFLKKASFVFLLLFVNNILYAQFCRFEMSNGTETTTYDEAIAFYKKLDSKSSKMIIKEMGLTDGGQPLHLVLISNDLDFNKTNWIAKRKTIILINNGIHAGEPDGIDASMIFARDIINGKIKLPNNVVIGIIPIYNIGGCLQRNSTTRVNQNGPKEYGFRGNAQNLDLNRDFIKADSKEAINFAHIFHYLDPHILVDTHVSDGADYPYTMTLLTTQYDKLGLPLSDFLRNKFEPSIYDGMKTKGYAMTPYVDFDNKVPEAGMTMFYDPPRYSSGYAALFGVMGFVTETHMLKPFAERVLSTYAFLNTITEKANFFSNDIFDNRILQREKISSAKKIALKYIVDTLNKEQIRFNGYTAESQKSNVTGFDKTVFNHNKPYFLDIPFLSNFLPTKEINIPKAYIIAAGWNEVIDRLKANNVVMKKLLNDTIVKAEIFIIESFKSGLKPYEKHHKNYDVIVSKKTESIKVLRGSYIVNMNQYRNRYIAETLEPEGEDGFFAWNFFDAILQQKEGYSDYRWEDIAFQVLNDNPSLKAAFENKKNKEPAFEKNASAQLNYIYQNSKYREPNFNRYPIYKLF